MSGRMSDEQFEAMFHRANRNLEPGAVFDLRVEARRARVAEEAWRSEATQLRRAVRERLPPSFLGAEILGLQAEIINLLDVLAQFVHMADRDEDERKRLVLEGAPLPFPWWPKDHACSECAPESGMLVDGFRCALHRARALLGSKENAPR